MRTATQESERTDADAARSDRRQNSERAPDAADRFRRERGNQAIQRLASEGLIQPKLAVGRPNDRFEREADRVAELVVDGESAGDASAEPAATAVDRAGVGEIVRQRDVSPGATSTADGAGVERSDLEAGGRGRPLPGTVRPFFESRFDRDFGDVRIHDGEDATALSEALGARAFTYGRDVYFGAGEYRPHDPEGRRLLAHELTHTVQQGATGRRVQRVPILDWFTGGDESESESAGGESEGGGVLGTLGSISDAAWACAEETGASVYRLVSGDFDSLTELLGLPQPQGPGPGTLEAVTAALDHPCLRMIPGYSQLSEAANLEEVSSFLVGAWRLMQNPQALLTPLKEALGEKIAQIPREARSIIESMAGVGERAQAHLDGIWRHLEPKLEYLAEHWWEVMKDAAWELIWPWEGAWEDVTKIWGHITTGASSLWDLEIGAATDELLAAWRSTNGLLGRFYGWFFIASVLVGTIIGAFFGGAGAIPGAAAGASVAAEVGYVLLASTVAAETANVVKAVVDLTMATTQEEREDAYGDISDSGLALGMMGVLAVLGAGAAKFARGMIARFPKVKVKLKNLARPGKRKAAWERYKQKYKDGERPMDYDQWKRSYDRLMENKETGEFFEKILQGEEGGARQVSRSVEEVLDPSTAGVRNVKGVGSVFEKRLQDAGIDVVEDLLAKSSDELATILQTGRKRASNVLEAARKLDTKVSHKRYVDVESGNAIFEVKTGSPDLTSFTSRQIKVDALLRDVSGYDPTWVFYRGGPTKALEGALKQEGIAIQLRTMPVKGVGVGAAGADAPQEIPAEGEE